MLPPRPLLPESSGKSGVETAPRLSEDSSISCGGVDVVGTNDEEVGCEANSPTQLPPPVWMASGLNAFLHVR